MHWISSSKILIGHSGSSFLLLSPPLDDVVMPLGDCPLTACLNSSWTSLKLFESASLLWEYSLGCGGSSPLSSSDSSVWNFVTTGVAFLPLISSFFYVLCTFLTRLSQAELGLFLKTALGGDSTFLVLWQGILKFLGLQATVFFLGTGSAGTSS